MKCITYFDFFFAESADMARIIKALENNWLGASIAETLWFWGDPVGVYYKHFGYQKTLLKPRIEIMTYPIKLSTNWLLVQKQFLKKIIT